MTTTLLDSYVTVTIGSHINNYISAEIRAIHPVNSSHHCRKQSYKTVLNKFSTSANPEKSRLIMHLHHYVVNQNY